MKPEHLLSLIEKIIWPLFFCLIYFLNKDTINRVFKALLLRIEAGAEIQFSNLKVGQIPSSLPAPKENEEINENHLVLLHSSWRYPKKDKEFGKEMYVIQIIVQTNDNVLDKIEYVKYCFHHSFPNRLQIRTNRDKKFEIKELAWGEFNLKAEVKIKGQTELIILNRYINLTITGKNLLKD